MAGGTTNAFELVFGVKGVGVGGESYEEIRKGIETIAKNLVGKQELNLKFGVDAAALETSIKNALKSKTFNVNIATSVANSISKTKEIPNANKSAATSVATGVQQKLEAQKTEVEKTEAAEKKVVKRLAEAKAEVIKLNHEMAKTQTGTQKWEELNKQLQTAQERYKGLQSSIGNVFTPKGVELINKAADASKAVTKEQNKQAVAVASANDKFNQQITAAREYIAAAGQVDREKITESPVGEAYKNALTNFYNTYSNQLNGIKFDSKNYGDQLAWLKKLSDAWTDVQKKKRDYENTLLGQEKIIAKVEDEIAKLQRAGYVDKPGAEYIKRLNDIKTAAQNGSKSVKELNTDFIRVSGEIQNAGANVETLGHALQRAFSEKFKYLIASMGIMYLRRSIRDLINNVKELDAAMTQIEIVTGESSAALERFGKRVAKTAKEVGASVTDIIKSTETYARLGYTLDESLNLADVTAKYANVAATDAESATSALTSIMKAFNYKPEQMEGVVDMLVKVGQEYAISAGELGDALQRGGAALAVGGASLEETIAIMTAGNAAVQNADTVGNALKTVSARIRTSTAELEEMGEEVDDLVSSSSKYRKEILALSGVDIMKNDNTYKSVYQILTEIAAVYDKLDDTSKARLLEDLGGKRNATVIGSIISNLDDLKGSYEAATNAAGTLAEANAIYLDSIEGKTKQIKSSWQTLSANILDNEFVKVLVDIARFVLDLFNKLDDATNGWSSTILTVYVGLNLVIAAFKTLSGMSFFQHFGTLVAGSFAKATAGATAFASALPGVSAGIMGVEGAMVGMQAVFGWAVIAAGAIALVVKGVKAYKDAHPSMEQLKADFEEASNKAEDYKSQQEEVNAKIEELHKRQANGERTAEIESELSILKSQNQALETQIKLYEDIAKAKNAEIEKQKSEEAGKYFTQRYQTQLVQGEQVVMSTSDLQGSSKVQQQIEEYKKLSEQIANAATPEEVERLEKQKTAIKQWFKDELEIIRGFIDDPTYGKEASSLVELISSVILGGMDDLTDGAEQKADDLADAIIPKTIDTAKKQIEAMEGAVDEYKKYGGLTQDTIDGLKNSIPGLVDALYDQNGELTEGGIAALKSDSALRTFAEDAIKAAKKVNGMSLSEAKQKLKELEAAAYSAAYSFTVAGKTMTVALDPQEKRARMEQIDALKKEIAQAENEIANTVNGWSKYNPNAGNSGSKKDTFKQGLENELKKLKHLLEMEKITYEQYYSGVAEIRNMYIANAYRDEDGYKEEILDLEEEIFNGRLTILQDFVNDYDHIIEKLTANGQILQAKDDYENVLKRIEQEMQWAINNGLDKNGDFMQELEKQWKTTAKNIVDMIQGVYDEFESYADDFEMWDKLPFSKDDFYDSDISKIKNYYAAGLLGEAEYVRMSNEIQKKRFDYHNDSLNEIIDLTIEMIEKESDDIVDAIDEEIDAYDKLIERKKKLLQDTADEADHEEEIADAVKEIAKLQSKISQLSLDDSRSAAAKKAELEEQLAEKQKELDKTQRDYALNQTMEALDESQDAFEKEKEAEKKAAEKSIETWMQKYEKAIDMLENDTEGTYKKLLEYADKYSTSIDGPDSIRTAWEAVLDVMKECGTFQNAASFIRNGENYGINPDIDGTISRDIVGEKYGVWIANKNNTSPAGVKTGDLVITGGGIYKRNQPGQESPLVETLTDYIGKPTTQNYADVEKAYAEYLRKHGLVYHNGGVVGRGTSQDNETVALLQKGEIVLDSKKKQALQDMLTQVGQMATYAAAVKASGRANTSYSTVGDTFAPHVEININHNGTLTANDAKHYGNVAADAALEKLRTAFNRRGL